MKLSEAEREEEKKKKKKETLETQDHLRLWKQKSGLAANSRPLKS